MGRGADEFLADTGDPCAGVRVPVHQRTPVPSYIYSYSNNTYEGGREVETKALRAKRKKQARRFLKGPIDWPDIQCAAQLPGKALAVYLAIRHRFDLEGSSEITLGNEKLAGLARTSHR